MSFVFSIEQSAVINCSKNETNTNVVVDAVAGSGKTSTIIGICKVNKTKPILILTYNRHLCQETSARLQSFKLTNGDIYTVHGFVYTFYNSTDYTDRIIRDTVSKDLPLKNLGKLGSPYEIIILDEFQDFNMHMLQTVIKYIRDVMLVHKSWKPRLYLLGDKYQCVYEDLQGSDNRFLIHAPSLFERFGEWKRFSLQTTYRLTDKTVEFINKAVLRSNFFVSNKSGKRKPQYLVSDPYSENLHNWIYSYIYRHNYEAEDIFILAPSIKNGNAPVYKLTNFLSDMGLPIFYSNQFDDVCNVKETENKVTVNTFHVCKGRERPLVIIYNFDASYFQWFAKDKSIHDCTNPQYVAFTRGLEDTILIQNKKESPLPFLDMDELEKTCDVTRLHCNNNVKNYSKTKSPIISVTELLDYQTFDVIHYADQFYTCKETQTDNVIILPSTVKSKIKVERVQQNVEGSKKRGVVKAVIEEKEVLENVSNLNGNLITLINEHSTTGSVGLLEHHDFVGSAVSTKNTDVRVMLGEMKSEKVSIYRKLTNAAMLMESEMSGTTHRLRQITNKNWLNEGHWKNIVENFTNAMGNNRKQFEKVIIDADVIRGVKLYGRVDVIDHEKKTIYEIKWVGKISDVHKIQLIIYYYLLCQEDEKYYDYALVLMNFKDGMRYEIETVDDVFPLIDYLVYMKYATKPRLTFEELEQKTKEMLDVYLDENCKVKLQPEKTIVMIPVKTTTTTKKDDGKRYNLLVDDSDIEEDTDIEEDVILQL